MKSWLLVTTGPWKTLEWIRGKTSRAHLPLSFNVKMPSGSGKKMRANQQVFAFFLFAYFCLASCRYFLVSSNRWVAIRKSPPPSDFSYFPPEWNFLLARSKKKKKRLIERTATHNIQTKLSQHFILRLQVSVPPAPWTPHLGSSVSSPPPRAPLRQKTYSSWHLFSIHSVAAPSHHPAVLQ